MLRLLVVLLPVSLVMLAALQAQPAPKNSVVEGKAEALLKQMTLEEKAGQMTQVTLQEISKFGNPTAPHQIDLAKVDVAAVNHHVGSILNATDGATTVHHWH